MKSISKKSVSIRPTAEYFMEQATRTSTIGEIVKVSEKLSDDDISIIEEEKQVIEEIKIHPEPNGNSEPFVQTTINSSFKIFTPGHQYFISEITKTDEKIDAKRETDIISSNVDNSQNYRYSTLLANNIEKYSGPNKDLMLYCPKFFDLLCNILNNRFTDWHTKILISAALGYFVLEDDIIADHHDNGYIDDLFLVAFVLKEIKEISPELILEEWKSDEDIIALIDEIYQKTSVILGDLTYDILRKVGLHKFKKLELEDYSGSYPQKLSKLANERRELLGLVLFLIHKVYAKNLKGYKVEQIKNMIKECGDADEIERLIELAKTNHSIEPSKNITPEDDFEVELEEKLQKNRKNALRTN